MGRPQHRGHGVSACHILNNVFVFSFSCLLSGNRSHDACVGASLSLGGLIMILPVPLIFLPVSGFHLTSYIVIAAIVVVICAAVAHC
jgi:uncharacterized membrane protein